METYVTLLGLRIINFDNFAKLIDEKFESDVPELFKQYHNLSHKDRGYLYLHYTLKGVISIFNLYPYKSVVIYVQERERDLTEKCILGKLEIIAKYFPIIICTGSHSFSTLNNISPSGEKTELISAIHEQRYRIDFSKFTPQRINKFYSKYKALKVFEKINFVM